MYYRPDKLSDALRWLADHKDQEARIAAGCTDLFPSTPTNKLVGPILDVTAIEELRRIKRTPGGWSFGGAVTWTQLIRHELPTAFDSIKLAAREVGSIQIQNAGTLAGNLCNAYPAADGSPCWLTLDAGVTLSSVRGSRILSLNDFLIGPRKTAIADDEVLTSIQVPSAQTDGQSTFLKLGARKYLVISIAMVAARLVVHDRRVADCAIAVGSCSGVPVRLDEVERSLVGKPAEENLAKHIEAVDVSASLSPINDVRGDAQYRLLVAAELVQRCISQLTATNEQAAA